jgi:spore maturation protein CgeB
LESALEGVDLVLVHEWNEPGLVSALGRIRARREDFALLFHDTHHRSVSCPEEIGRYDLSGYDGVLAFGRAIQSAYIARGWARRAWVWHEAADVHLYRPLERERDADVIWIGNWGDDERSRELETFFVEPVTRAEVRATVCGVRYPDHAAERLRRAGIRFRGWAAAGEVVEQYARHRMTVHIPRRYYADVLPGIPTIRVFEALACGIPLICAPWRDVEGLFSPGADYLVARDGAEMTAHMTTLAAEPGLRRELAARGRRTILARHTCEHRVDELMEICRELGLTAAASASDGQRNAIMEQPA